MAESKEKQGVSTRSGYRVDLHDVPPRLMGRVERAIVNARLGIVRVITDSNDQLMIPFEHVDTEDNEVMIPEKDVQAFLKSVQNDLGDIGIRFEVIEATGSIRAKVQLQSEGAHDAGGYHRDDLPSGFWNN
jgi:hypothetical protein